MCEDVKTASSIFVLLSYIVMKSGVLPFTFIV